MAMIPAGLGRFRAPRAVACAGVLLCAAWPAQGQNAPLTESVAPAPAVSVPARPVVRQAAAAPAPAAAPAAASGAARPEMGDVTRLLLAAQADGRRAGTSLPMLGEAADRAWRRYMDSFSQPIPQWFDQHVEIDE